MRAVVLLVLLVVLSPSFAQAQRRGGGGELRGGQVRSQEEGPDSIGKYGLRRTDVLELVSAGEGAPALEAYQRAAAEAEQKGRLGTAARAGAAAVLVAARLGMLQTILTLAPHVMEVAGKAPPSREVAKAMVNTAVSLSGAHLAVNEHAQARAVLETALAYSQSGTAAQYRRAMVGPIASLLERLSSIELAQGDRASALAHVSGGDLVIWALDGASLQARRVRRDRDALLAELRDFRAAIASQAPLAEVEPRAQALYQTLIGPVEPLIRGKRLVIVPHDVLHYLPFSALRSPDGRWLVEEHAFTTVPSASVLKFLVDKGAQASDRILAVGNPDLGPALALPWAEREVRALGDRYPTTSTVLVRADASESRVKQQAGQAGLIHFAVHGELNETDPMASALLLDPGNGEDGRFEVREIFSTELSARLVVLSACETGLGKLSRGDELVGLQRAFLYAGTPAVVTTLWKVDDRASFLLMRRFYEELKAKGPAQALRAAQRSLIVDYPHPFSWAGYGLTGVAR
jgi:CHAT domain-containing protein